MEVYENESYWQNETEEYEFSEAVSCEGVLNLEGITFAINSTLLEDTLALFYDGNHHYQDIPAWVFIVLLIVGFSGNLVNVFVYSRPFMRTPINYILCALEFVNIFLFATFIPDLIRYFNPEVTLNLGQVVVDIGLQVVESAVVSCSNWLTVAVGVWRYVAISRPLNVDKWCNKKKTKLTIAAIVIASAAITIPGAFMHSLEHVEFNVTYEAGTPNEYFEIRRIYKTRTSQYACDNPSLDKLTTGLILLTTSIPCFCLVFVTILLLLGLWKAKRIRERMTSSGPSAVRQPQGIIPFNKKVESDQLREKRITVVLIFLVVLFFLAYLPDAVLNIIVLTRNQEPKNEEEDDEADVGTHRDTVFYKIIRTRIFILGCNCLTFFIYYFMSVRYREAFVRSFCPSKFKKELNKVSNGTISSTAKGQSVKDISLVQFPGDGQV